jgi:beta-glucosidase
MRDLVTQPTPWILAAIAASLAAAGCHANETLSPLPDGGADSGAEVKEISFGAWGSISEPSGKGSFRFGASSAATQIEDQNPSTDWYLWTQPKPDGLGNGVFVGDASKGYTKAIEDIDLLTATHLDSYRFSMEWARIEPKKGMIDEAAITHYRDFLTALKAKGIRPNVTVHHFSNPVWVDDPRDPLCVNGPTDQNLCGIDHPAGGPLVIKAMADHAKLLGERFGDLVDDWATLNEPVNYLLSAYGAGIFPPGKFGAQHIETQFVPAIRNYIEAHAQMYKALKAADTKDADGDGVAASVGLTKEAAEWVASAGGMPSQAKRDTDARERMLWLYEYLFVDALREGSFDSDLDGLLDEPHPDWKGTLDWLGVQYYSRVGVTGASTVIPVLDLAPCFGGFDYGSCVPPLDPTYWVPTMQYEHDPAGLGAVLLDFGKRWPELPLTVTESGMATEVGARRAEMIVRALEQVDLARAAGVDVRGYYHWSIYDNFEWAHGFVPRFGLYKVDFTTYTRTPTEGATVFAEIAAARRLTAAQRTQYGGSGPFTPEP